jgi:hypothetical protein
MDRQQKIEQTKKQDRVSKISNVIIAPKHLDPEYESELCSGVETDTGYLEILKIVPKSGQGSYFTARWDQKPEKLDLDMHGASNSAKRKFKNDLNAYSGHHTERSSTPDKRIFEVTIKMSPERIIFDGEVSFSNTYEVHVNMHAEAKMTVDAVVIRALKK